MISNIFIALVGVLVFIEQVFNEYQSTVTAIKTNNRVNKTNDDEPLNKILLNQQRLGYFLEGLIGGSLIFGVIFLTLLFVHNLWIALVVLLVLVFLFLKINDFIYSAISNHYMDNAISKYKRDIIEESNNIPQTDTHVSKEFIQNYKNEKENQSDEQYRY